MTAKAQQQEGLTAVLTGRWEAASRKLVELAEAVPAEQFDSRPLAGVRSVGEVLRHVAFWNQYVADSLRGTEADGSGNELPRDAYATKASIVEALKRTSASASAALGEPHGTADSKTAELLMTFVEHTAEHYGQLVVYARLMNIVPPASRT
jgi:uncharacterized damage-inducible protein DinB